MSEVDRPGDRDCLPHGGEMGTRIRAFDWATTPLGSPDGWPPHLKDAIASHLSEASVNAPGCGDERGHAEGPPAEEALRESEARLRAVIEEAPLAIALTGPSGEILLRNPRFDQLWGRPAHVTTAPTYSDVYEGYHLDGRRIASEEWPGARALLKGEIIENELYEIVQASGNRIACWFGAAPLRNTAGEIVGAVVVFRDVTDERRTAEALRKAYVALAEADRRKDEFIAVLSHELRNPLAPIRYALPLLRDQPLEERGRRATAVIERQVAHLVRLVDDLLDVSRIATGKIELRRDLLTLGSIVSTAVEAASPAIAAARHSLEIALPDAPVWLHVDPARISQALTNLLNNSAKYTPQGGRIRLEAAADEGSVTIRVIDNGVGLDRQVLTTVFEMFRQTGDRNGSEGGLGIGLTLARQLVEMHGGSIQAYSAGEGLGSEFAVRLPRAIATTPRNEPQPPPAGQGHAGRVKVLVVDDNVDLVEMLAMVVEVAGHHVRKAFDGRSGISAALEYQPDLILLDVGMSDMNGTEVAKELRRHRALAGTRIVALTGWGQVEDRQRTAEAGFDDHLTKPAEPEQIHRILDEVAARVHD